MHALPAVTSCGLLLMAASAAALPAQATRTYDMRPLAEVDAGFSALQEAVAARDWRTLRSRSDQLARGAGDRAVWAASVWLAWRACQRLGDRRCARARARVLADGSPFSAAARIALASAGGGGEALELIAAIPIQYAARYRLTVDDAWRSQRTLRPAHEAVLAALEDLGGEGLSRRDRCRLDFMRGLREERRGAERAEGAARHFLRVWQGRCGALADEGLERLAVLGRLPEPLERVERVAMSRRPRGRRARRRAEKQLLRTIEEIASGVSGLPTYGRARLYARDRRRRKRALDLYQKVLRIARGASLKAWARYRRGDLLGKLGRDAEAIRSLEPLLGAPVPAELDTAVRWRLFRLYRARRRWLDTEKMLTEVKDRNARWRDQATWELAWRRFRLGDTSESLRLFDELRAHVAANADDGKEPWRARLDYWRGRAHLLLGDAGRARALFASVALHNPHTYYGLIALDRLRALDPERAAKLMGSPLPSVDLPLQTTALVVEHSPLLDGPVLLLRMGMPRQAGRLLRGVVRGLLPRDGVHLLAAVYHLAGRPGAAYAVLRRHSRRAARPDATTAAIWRAAYATPFPELFAEAAHAAGIPRSLLYAVARHESHFAPTATSRAGAIGLVQLLPSVAARIAELYDLPRHKRWHLRRPAWNLALGARYLAQLNRFLLGNYALVLAAYNAGPYAIRRWIRRTGSVPTDVFVESIPFGQARNYTRAVLATARAYAMLHPEWGEAEAIDAGRRPMVFDRQGPFMVRPSKALQADGRAHGEGRGATGQRRS